MVKCIEKPSNIKRFLTEQYKIFKKDKDKECQYKYNSKDSLTEMKLKRKNVGKFHKETFKLKEMSDKAV